MSCLSPSVSTHWSYTKQSTDHNQWPTGLVLFFLRPQLERKGRRASLPFLRRLPGTSINELQQTSSPVPPCGKLDQTTLSDWRPTSAAIWRNIRAVFDSGLFAPLCKNMTSSTKPEVHITWNLNVWFWDMRADRQTNEQTDTQTRWWQYFQAK